MQLTSKHKAKSYLSYNHLIARSHNRNSWGVWREWQRLLLLLTFSYVVVLAEIGENELILLGETAECRKQFARPSHHLGSCHLQHDTIFALWCIS